MKRLILLTIGFCLLFVLTACSNDPVQDDLLNYINKELVAVVEIEKKAFEGYASVTGDNFVDDKTTANHLAEVVIPKYKEVLEHLEEIKPKTKEVSGIHEIYIEASNIQFNGVTAVLEALNMQDTYKLAEAIELIEEGGALMDQLLIEMDDLAKEHNIEIEN